MGHRSTALALALATLCASCADTFRGSATSPAVTAVAGEQLFAALVAAPEGRGERELRGDYAAAFPRAAAAFGRGFSVDSVRAAAGALGTTSVALTLGFHPEKMAPAFPAFASYLDKYLKHAKYHF